MEGRIHSIESFGTVDGPGIRLVVFFQGCPMRCLYCHNPDTWQPSAGEVMTAEDILALYRKNKAFYKKGGITATGGEPMLQLDFLTELFEKARAEGIHTCLDTSGVTFRTEQTERYDRLLAATDLVMLDIKHAVPERHRALTGHANENILAFAKHASEKGVPLWIRHVVVPGWTDDEASLAEVGRLMAQWKTVKALDVLPYHDMGVRKYQEMGITYPLTGVPALSNADAQKARAVILNAYREAKMNCPPIAAYR